TRVVCVSGQVKHPGAYEIQMGTPLREVIYGLAGGTRDGHTLKAVLIGGAAGAFLRPDEIDVALDFQSLSAVGATFGSGAVMIMDETANLHGVLRRLARFFRDESCGKCFPCQLGTQRQLEIVERADSNLMKQSGLLHVLGGTMRDASLCGLGQTASSAILSALDKGLVD
ncbi:MAG: SLBB domain-containing protein, partial [Chloroflexi bacterium]|nr:SLBB domain-containing protein [Chloroflexota bacterium]